jgi:hypothetical protein
VLEIAFEAANTFQHLPRARTVLIAVSATSSFVGAHVFIDRQFVGAAPVATTGVVVWLVEASQP